MNKLVLLACVYFSLVLCNEYYSWDGSNNNLANPTWGQQGSQLTRDYPTLPYNYEDGISQPVNGPNARVISNTLMSIVPANPYSHVGVNDLHTTWGYFMAHDISRTLGSSEATPIPVPYSDPYWNPLGLNSSVLPQSKISISFTRKKGSPSNATMPRNQYYASTPYLDLQTFYGMNATYNYAFRLKSDTQRGRLKTSAGNNLPFDPLGNGLPASFNQAALGSNKTAFCGDTIIHSYPTSVGIATIFLREHNRLADQFAAAHPEWTDDQVFNEARRWLIAIYQSITYNEYIPATTSLPPPKYEGYNATVMPGVQALWLGATVRYGHTEINSVVHALDENWNQHPLGDVLVRDYWRLTSTLIGKYTTVDPIIRGALMSHQQEVDLYYADEMRVYTLGYPGRGGTDAGSATVQRGRDYGLPYFNDVRAAFGLEPKETWAEITSNPTIASLLESLYNTTDKLDFFVGALAEDHPGLHMGETFTAAFNNQLMRSIHTDRLFYKSPYANFTAAEIAEIENTKLSTLILRNFPEIPSVQCSAFYVSKVKDCGVQPNITCDTNENPNTVSLFEGNVKASWTLNAAEDAVTVTVVANTTGWVAFGFAKEAGRMIGADIVAGWVDDASSTSHVYDMTANAKQECSAGTGVCADSDIGGTDDLSYKLASQANGMTTLTFTRKLVTGDALDMPLAVNTDIAIVAAFGTSDGPLYYHGQNKVAATIRLVGSSSTTTTTSGSTSTTGQAVESTTGDGANLSGVERSAYSLLLVIVAFALYMF